MYNHGEGISDRKIVCRAQPRIPFQIQIFYYVQSIFVCTLGPKNSDLFDLSLHWDSVNTVVKWGHTEGIPREKTSSQKYTVIALHFWRDEFFLVFQIWGQNTIGGQFLEHCHLIWNCPWFLKRFLIFQIWGYYLQKVIAKGPQISDENDKFFFHW